MADSHSRREAEAELAEREKRVRGLDIRPLDAATLDRYALQWNVIQEQFVDAPANSVTSAQSLITAVMNDRGYPTEDSGQIMADLSVDYARTIEEFRTAQELSGRVVQRHGQHRGPAAGHGALPLAVPRAARRARPARPTPPPP